MVYATKINCVSKIVYTKIVCWTGTSADGTLLTKQHNPAVSQNVLAKIKALKTQGQGFNEIIDVLRPTTVPRGYTPCWWREGI